MIKSPCTPECKARQCACQLTCEKYKIYKALLARKAKNTPVRSYALVWSPAYAAKRKVGYNFNKHRIL